MFTDSQITDVLGRKKNKLKIRVCFTRAIVHRFTLVIGRLRIRLNAVVLLILVRVHIITLTSVTAVLQKRAYFP